jgi:hypothetical protein
LCTLDAQHGYGDVVANGEHLSDAPSKYQHLPFLCVDVPVPSALPALTLFLDPRGRLNAPFGQNVKSAANDP